MLPSDASFTANSAERWLQLDARAWRAEPLLNSMLPSGASFTANSAERLLQPARSSRKEPSRYLAPIAAVLIYVLMALLLVFEDKYEPVAPPAPVEIPIEIVAEPPPPPPPPPPPAPSPPPPAAAEPIDEKPAYDAPRPANDEKVEREAPDPVTKAPPAPTPTKPPGQDAETGKATAPQPEPEAETPAKETPADPAKDKTIPEPAPTGEVKQQEPPPPQTHAETEVPPQPPAASAGSPIPKFDPVPDVKFSGAAKAAPVAGGNAKARYLTIVYGMIVPRVHKPAGAHPKWARADGVVSFSIDGKGYLTQRWTTQPSGSPELDAAIFEAIGAASPFPPPPGGKQIYLHITYRPD